MAVPIKPQTPENLNHAVVRMRQQGFTDAQIAGQVQKWHPDWNAQQITAKTGILTGGPLATQSVAPKTPVVNDDPPNPVLQKHGYIGGITSFNNRVQTVVNSYQQAYGQKPSPGLVFDLARSPIDDHQFSSMFTVPQNPLAAQARAIVQNHPPDQLMTVRQDGYRVRNNPAAFTPQQAHKEFPWVDQASMLPLPTKLLGDFWNSLATLGKNQSIAKPLLEGGLTLDQYSRENQLAQGLVNPTPGTGKNFNMESLLSGAEKQQNVVYGVSTIRQVQQKLQDLAPEYFGRLPQSGFINQDWAKAISQYQSSTSYFQQQTKQLAADNHFGSNTAAFIKAWKAKQDAIKKYPGLARFLQAQPLAVFSGGPDAFRNYLTGDTKGLGWINVPTWGLNVIAHTAQFAANELGATLDQVKVEAAAGRAYLDKLNALTPQNTLSPTLKVNRQTEAEARKAAAEALQKNPSWANAFDIPTSGDLAPAGQIANAAIDLLIGFPGFTGEEVAAGDIAKLKQSRYFNAKTTWAFNTLAKHGEDGVAEAALSLEGGLGAEKIANRYAQQIKDGEMSLAEFQQRAAELYAHGTTIDGEVSGPLLRSLRGKGIPTKGPVGQSFSAVHDLVKGVLDDWENTLRARKQGVGGTSHAANAMSSVRQAFARAAPNGVQHLFDEKLPGDIYNWTVKNLKDRELAAKLRNDFVRARAADDVQGMASVNDQLQAAYAAANPGKVAPSTPFSSSGPEIESEQRSYFQFPTAIEEGAKKVNQTLNKIGAKHRQVIVGGSPNPLIVPFVPGFGETLAYKHATADTVRRIAGGGGLFGVGPELRATRSAVEKHLNENPADLRNVGVNRSQAVMGEQRWITGKRFEAPQDYRTGEAFSDSAKMEGAGAYLRHMISSDALKAYQQSTKDDLGPLINLVLKDKTYRAMMASTDAYKEGIAALKKGVLTQSMIDKGGRSVITLGSGSKPEIEAAIRDFTREQAQAYAELLWKRYKEVEDAGITAGLEDPFGSALGELVKNVGPKGDKKLGKWITKNQVDFPVRDGLVEKTGFDSTMTKWISVLMSANKWNRGKLFDHVFYSTVKNLTDAGWQMGHAIPVASDLAKAQTVYHMLDFSNMLQVEQDLRWLSYFSTKHRLYWTWIGRYIARHPGSAAIISDVSRNLDNKGNIQLTAFGHRIYIPVARLFWVNSRDYPQTSPLVQFGAEFGKGVVEGHGVGAAASDAIGSLTSTSGNLLTRDDQAEMYALKLAGVATGSIKPSAAIVTAGLSPTLQKQFYERVNEYANLYHAEHGFWPTEADAVKHTLMSQAAQESWRANLPLPFTWDSPGAETPKVKQEMDAYGRILDPVKKRAYLDNHPEVALRFGIAQDPAVYLHNAPLWDKFNAAQKWLQTQRKAIWQEILKTGFTPEIKNQMKVLSNAWQHKIDALKLEDATTWTGNTQFPAGKVSDGMVVTPGPWGTQLEGDPLHARAFIHQAFPGVTEAQLNSRTVGERIVTLQEEAARLRAANTPAKIAALGYPDAQHVRDRLSQINTLLAPFFTYPKDAPSQAQSDYYNKFVVPYINERDKKSAALALLPQDQQDAARSEFRAWKDAHDHPVFMTIDGHKIKFPSVVQIGWSTLPADQRHLGLAQAVSGDWAHVASYEKTMLGVKTPADVSQGWAAFADAVAQYNKDPNNQALVQAQKVGLAKQIDKVYPGFYKDFLFSQQPKIDRFQATSLYQQMADRKEFDQYIAIPAKQVAKAIKANGSSRYYERYWRNYVENEIVPWLDTQPQLKKELADYGTKQGAYIDFLNTLVSN